MISIKSINWFDKDSCEGELTLIDSKLNELICFIYQLNLEDINLNDLYAMINTDVIRSDVNSYCLTHIENFEYYIVGQLLDKKNRKIKCFDYVFEIDGYLPGDIHDGDWIEFGVGRFNL